MKNYNRSFRVIWQQEVASWVIKDPCDSTQYGMKIDGATMEASFSRAGLVEGRIIAVHGLGIEDTAQMDKISQQDRGVGSQLRSIPSTRVRGWAGELVHLMPGGRVDRWRT